MLPWRCGRAGGIRIGQRQAQTETQDPRKRTRSGSPTDDFARIVELDLGWETQGLPALTQEGQNGVHLAGAVDSQANGAIKNVLSDQDVVPLPLALEIDRAPSIDLMKLIGLLGRGCRVAEVRD